MKDIPEYEGLYAATRDGKIWSYPKYNSKDGKGIWLQPIKDQKGYYRVSLYDSSQKIFQIHRLIALTFIPNPLNNLYVNHKNGIKTDNRIQNLEWCTSSENALHAFRIIKTRKSPCAGMGKFGKDHHNSKIIFIENLKGIKTKCYGYTDGERLTGISAATLSTARKRKVECYKLKQGKFKGFIIHFSQEKH